MTQIETTPEMTPTRVYPVDHEEQMAYRSSRTRLINQKLARIMCVFHPYSSGMVFTPSSGMAQADRDPRTKRVLPTPVIVECYMSEVAEILAWVEPRMELVREVYASHEESERAFLAANFPGRYIAPDRNEWDDEMRAMLIKMPVKDNPAAKFRVIAHRDIKPLLSAEVIETDLPAPLDGEQKNRRTMVEAIARAGQPGSGLSAETLADAFTKALLAAGVGKPAGGVSDEEAEKLRKQNDGMREKIKALEAKLAGK